jgi:osmotically-inducible protein OsmY
VCDSFESAAGKNDTMDRFARLLPVALVLVVVAACTPQQERTTQSTAQRDVHAAGVQLSDHALEVKVGAAIAAEAGTNIFHITPYARDGIVTLSGTVPSRAIHQTVLRTARDVPGVKGVIDRISVR